MRRVLELVALSLCLLRIKGSERINRSLGSSSMLAAFGTSSSRRRRIRRLACTDRSIGWFETHPDTDAAGEESLPQGLKPVLWLVLDIRAKARTYLRSNSKSVVSCFCRGSFFAVILSHRRRIPALLSPQMQGRDKTKVGGVLCIRVTTNAGGLQLRFRMTAKTGNGK